MTLNICDICNGTGPANCLRNNIGAANSIENWRRAVIEILCGISGAIGAGGNVSNVPQKVIDAATLQSTYGTYASPGLLDATKKLSDLFVTNTSDADIQISLDGGATTAFTVLANDYREIHIGNYTGAATNSFMIRRANSMTAGIGNLTLEGTYAS